MTDKDTAAKNWEMLEQRKELRARVARLQNELDSYTTSWSKMAKLYGDRHEHNYGVTPKEIEILHLSVRETLHPANPVYAVEYTVPLKHFDIEAIKTLLIDLSDSREKLFKLKAEIQALGVD